MSITPIVPVQIFRQPQPRTGPTQFHAAGSRTVCQISMPDRPAPPEGTQERGGYFLATFLGDEEYDCPRDCLDAWIDAGTEYAQLYVVVESPCGEHQRRSYFGRQTGWGEWVGYTVRAGVRQ